MQSLVSRYSNVPVASCKDAQVCKFDKFLLLCNQSYVKFLFHSMEIPAELAERVVFDIMSIV